MQQFDQLAPLPDLFVVVRTDAPPAHADRVFLLSTWQQGRPGVLWHRIPTVFPSAADAHAFLWDHRDMCPEHSTNWMVRRYQSVVVPLIPLESKKPAPKTVTISRTLTVPCGFLLTCSDGRTAIVTLDDQFPGLAQNFGWSLSAIRWNGSKCRHLDTNGSEGCPVCDMPVEVIIDESRKYLMDNCPITVPDPGYFADNHS